MPTLQEISDKYQEVFKKLEELGDDVSHDEILSNLEEIDNDFDDKVTETAWIINNLEAQADAVKKERDRLDKRQKRLEKISLALREYIKVNMNKRGIAQLEIPLLFHISICKSPPKVEVYNDELIPAVFIDMIPHINKTRIKECIKNGQEVEGARLIEDTHLRIK